VSTLSDDELARIKAELLDNVLGFGAEPYIGIRAVYSIIQENCAASSVAATTSATAVTAAGPAVLTLASAAGYASGQRIQLDCDGQRETVTLRNLSGTSASVICRKTHSGTYPIEVESPVTLVRGLLADLAGLEQCNTLDAFAALGLKRVDEVEWQTAVAGSSVFDLVQGARATLRRELAARVGLSQFLAGASGRGGTYEQY
jgi:hypothetical protein